MCLSIARFFSSFEQRLCYTTHPKISPLSIQLLLSERPYLLMFKQTHKLLVIS
jgi:hypothetical protein